MLLAISFLFLSCGSNLLFGTRARTDLQAFAFWSQLRMNELWKSALLLLHGVYGWMCIWEIFPWSVVCNFHATLR